MPCDSEQPAGPSTRSSASITAGVIRNTPGVERVVARQFFADTGHAVAAQRRLGRVVEVETCVDLEVDAAHGFVSPRAGSGARVATDRATKVMAHHHSSVGVRTNAFALSSEVPFGLSDLVVAHKAQVECEALLA